MDPFLMGDLLQKFFVVESRNFPLRHHTNLKATTTSCALCVIYRKSYSLAKLKEVPKHQTTTATSNLLARYGRFFGCGPYKIIQLILVR